MVQVIVVMPNYSSRGRPDTLQQPESPLTVRERVLLELSFPTEEQAEGEHMTHLGQQRSGIGLVCSFDFCDAVLGQVDVVALRQAAAWVPHVPQHGVHEHEGCFEDVEEPLVPQYRTERSEGVEVVEAHCCIACMLYQTVQAPDQYQHHTDVQRAEESEDGRRAYVGSDASPVENGREKDEDQNDRELDRKGGDRQAASHGLLAVRRRWVGGEGHS